VPGITRAFRDSPQASEEAAEWSSLFEFWRESMRRLGWEFRHGQARVDPLHDPQSCRYCGLDLLCRIHELRGSESEPRENDE